MSTNPEYFDITKLYPVFDKEGWPEGKKFMQFWAEGKSQIAKLSRGKATVGANINSGLRIYTMQWDWLLKFPVAVQKLNTLLYDKAIGPLAIKGIIRNYINAPTTNNVAISHFNSWARNGLQPAQYLGHHTLHQRQLTIC